MGTGNKETPMIMMRFMNCYSLNLIFLLMINCTGAKNSLRTTTINERATKQIDALKDFAHQFFVMPGQVTFIYFPYFGPFKSEVLICNGNKIPFFVSPVDHQAMAYVSRSYFDSDRDFACAFTFIDDINESDTKIVGTLRSITARDHQYAQEHLRVSPQKIILSETDAARVLQEQKMLDELFEQSSPSFLFDEPFTSPLKSKITSAFGTKRIFNGKVHTEHLGMDFRAATGTKITAANRGEVVFVGDLFFGGHTVIIDHGLGVFTSYSHLSKILCQTRQQVDKKTILGFSGMTGRANGPHLHWGAKINGHWVDGSSLIEASKENFDHKNVDSNAD